MAKKKSKKKATKKKTKKSVKKPQKKVLTQLQENFLREYVVVRNATEAAKRAGVQGNNLKQRGHQILHDPLVQEKLKTFTTRKWNERIGAFDRMLDRLEFIACDDFEEADITDVVKWSKDDVISMTLYEDISPQARRSIKSLKQVISKSGDMGVAVEMKDTGQALAAMKMLGDYLGLKEYMKEMKAREKEVHEKAQSGTRERTESTRMERLLDNARLYKERAGSKGSDNS